MPSSLPLRALPRRVLIPLLPLFRAPPRARGHEPGVRPERLPAKRSTEDADGVQDEARADLDQGGRVGAAGGVLRLAGLPGRVGRLLQNLVVADPNLRSVCVCVWRGKEVSAQCVGVRQEDPPPPPERICLIPS